MHKDDVAGPPRRTRRSLIAAATIAGLILAGSLLMPIRQPRLFLVELGSRQSCDQLLPVVDSATDRFELTGASWLGGTSEAGHCVITAYVTGFGATAEVSETRLIQYLRDQVGMPQASLSKTVVLEE
jgi:hypothetical protein